MSRADARGWGPGWPNCQSGKQVRVTAGGVTVQVRREVAPLVEHALRKTRESGYVLKQDQTGAFVCRPIGGTSTPSNHSWGLAIDLNWRENPFTRDPNARRTITPEVVRIWKSIGWEWGGDWSGKKDYMHFEETGTPADVARRVAALGSHQQEDYMTSDEAKALLTAIRAEVAKLDEVVKAIRVELGHHGNTLQVMVKALDQKHAPPG